MAETFRLRIYNQLPRCFGPVSNCGLRHPKFTPPLTYSAFLVGDFCWPFVWKIVKLKQQTMNRHLSCQNDAFFKKKLPTNGEWAITLKLVMLYFPTIGVRLFPSPLLFDCELQ